MFDGDDDAPPTKRTRAEVALKSAPALAAHPGKTADNAKTTAKKGESPTRRVAPCVAAKRA